MLLLKPVAFSFSRSSAACRSMRCAAPTRQQLFHLEYNRVTGKSEWIVIEEEGEEDDERQTTPKALLATTSYLDMLNDTRRNRAFRLAIDKTVTKPCHVLDIGAGTGLLSMMAARAMGLSNSEGNFASKGTVTACESYLPMLKLMRKVLRANNMDGKIHVVNKRSDELEVGKDIPSRADVLVSEILDSELLGEGLIPTLQHAHDKLLVENPLTIPYKATTYGQLVECTHLWEMHDLVNREAKASDGIDLVPSGMADLLSVKQKQFSMHCNSLRREIKLLSEPFKIFDFDFWRRPDSCRETELLIKPSNDGTVHAIISWWLLQLDKDGTIFYSTGPEWIARAYDNDGLLPSKFGSENWCDHWKQTVWFTQSPGVSVAKDEELKLLALHSETSISYEFMASCKIKDVGLNDNGTQDSQIFLSPERNAIYGDSSWRCLMVTAVLRALQCRAFPLCLIPDDSIFLTVAVSRFSKNSHVISLYPGIREKGLLYLETVAGANNYTMDRIEVLKKRDIQLTLNGQRKVNLLIAEPFYYSDNSILPWKNLRFWKDRTTLDPILSKDVLIMPCRAILKACAMYLPDLWRSRRCLREIEGFDHSMVNSTLGACGDSPVADDCPFLPFYIWQSGNIKILSEIVTVLEFDFSKSMTPCSGKTQAQFREDGVCHGVVLWIDWVMDANDDASILSTGPDKRHWKQAVKLLSKPVEVRTDVYSSIEIRAFFDPTYGDLTMQHMFL